jgi:hypothetical protein
MTNKKTIALIVGSTLLLGVLVYWIIGLLSFSTYTKPLIKFEEVINGATIRIEESLGGATSSDYLLVYQNDSLIKREKIADPIIIDKVVSKNDSLFIYFADSVYFITCGEWHNCLAL